MVNPCFIPVNFIEKILIIRDYATKNSKLFYVLVNCHKEKKNSWKKLYKKRNRHALRLPVSCEEINFIFHKGNF